MLDLQFIRDHTDAVKAAITNKSAGDPASVDTLLELDADWRRITTDLQETQTLANTAARQIGELMKSGQKDQAQSAIAESSRLKGVTKELEDAQRQAQDALSALLLEIPNVPHSSVPVGATPDDNVTAYEWGVASPNLILLQCPTGTSSINGRWPTLIVDRKSREPDFRFTRAQAPKSSAR